MHLNVKRRMLTAMMEEDIQLQLFDDADFTELVSRSDDQRYNANVAVATLSGAHRVALPILSLRAFSVTGSGPVFEIAPVLLTEHMLVFVTEGELSCLIGGTSYTASAGDCLYAAPGTMFSRPATETPAAYIALCFWDDTPRDAGTEDRICPYPPMMPYAEDPDVTASVGYFRRVSENGTPDQRKKQLAALQILLIQLEDFVLRYSPNDHVREMKKYTLLHYREGVTLEALAECVGLHPVYCAKVFRDAEGITVGDFINRLRIARACAQLEDAIETSDVARDLGLSEYYFSRWFRRMMGVTPTEYRATLRGAYVKH